MRVVCVGDCGIDRYLGQSRDALGGITLNFAVHARRLFQAEDSIQVVSAVGDDAEGRLVLSYLNDAGVQTHVRVLSGRTPLQPIEVMADGDRVFVDYRAGVLETFELDSHARGLIAASDLLVAPLYVQIQRLFDSVMACTSKGLRAVDFADIADDPRLERILPYLDRLDIAFFGLSVAEQDFIDELKGLAKSHAKLFVITLGADGSLAVNRDTQVRCAALPVPRVVDTTGAGDSFAAAFLAAYCHGASLADSLGAGARYAATVIGHLGAH